jgi:hypothetical protein
MFRVNVTEVAIVKRMQAAFILCAVALGMLASAPALAWHHGGHVRFGVVIGGPFYPWGYYPPYYPYYPYPPAAPATPPTYIEQGNTQAPPQQPSGYWYYCADSKTYYPYVKECPAGWQRVTPQPAPGG